MSGLPLTADISGPDRHFAFVPLATQCGAANRKAALRRSSSVSFGYMFRRLRAPSACRASRADLIPGGEQRQGSFAVLRLVVHKFELTRLQWGLLKMMNRWRQEAVDVRLLHELAEEVRGARLPIDH